MGLVTQSAATFVTRILVTLVNIPISILVARTLGVDGQGVYAAAQAFPTLWATFWMFGLDAAHTWTLAGRRTTLGRILANGIVWVLVLSALAVPSYLWASRLLDPEKVQALLPVVGITAGIVPLVLARYLLLSCFLGLHRVDQYNILAIASQLLLLITLLFVLLVLDGGTKGAVAAYAGSIGLLLVLSTVWLLRRREPGDRIRPDAALMKTSLWYGIRGYGTTVFGQMTYRFDQVLVTQFAGITQQGWYSIAVLLAEKLTHITNSLQLVLFPKVSASTPEEANRITAAACRHGLFWVALAGIALFIIREPIVRILYGSRFLPALAPFAILLPGIFLLSFSKVLTVDLSGRNRRFPSTIAMGAAMVVNTALNLWWIPRWGMIGAAWASTVSYALQSSLMVLFFLRITGVPFRKLVTPESGDVDLYRKLIRDGWRRLRR